MNPQAQLHKQVPAAESPFLRAMPDSGFVEAAIDHYRGELEKIAGRDTNSLSVTSIQATEKQLLTTILGHAPSRDEASALAETRYVVLGKLMFDEMRRSSDEFLEMRYPEPVALALGKVLAHVICNHLKKTRLREECFASDVKLARDIFRDDPVAAVNGLLAMMRFNADCAIAKQSGPTHVTNEVRMHRTAAAELAKLHSNVRTGVTLFGEESRASKVAGHDAWVAAGHRAPPFAISHFPKTNEVAGELLKRSSTETIFFAWAKVLGSVSPNDYERNQYGGLAEIEWRFLIGAVQDYLAFSIHRESYGKGPQKKLKLPAGLAEACRHMRAEIAYPAGEPNKIRIQFGNRVLTFTHQAPKVQTRKAAAGAKSAAISADTEKEVSGKQGIVRKPAATDAATAKKIDTKPDPKIWKKQLLYCVALLDRVVNA